MTSLAAAERSQDGTADDAAPSPKREAIIEAATECFLEAGYGAVSMDAIAHRAGVSKQTIYNHFGSKEDLFGAIIRGWCDQLLTPLLTPEIKAAGIEAALTSVARQFVELLLSPRSLALYRVLIAEAPRFPELGRISYLSGAAPAVDTLAHYLDEQRRTGGLAVQDSRLAAEQFFGMLNGHMQIRALLGIEPSPPPDAVAASIRRAVQTFLCAYLRDAP